MLLDHEAALLYAKPIQFLIQRCSLQACKSNLQISRWIIILLDVYFAGSKISLCWNLGSNGTLSYFLNAVFQKLSQCAEIK
jgi:hypothetical protein